MTASIRLQSALSNVNYPINLVGFDSSNKVFIFINDERFLVSSGINKDPIQNIFTQVHLNELADDSIAGLSNSLKERIIKKIDASMIQVSLNFVVELLTKEQHRRQVLHEVLSADELALMIAHISLGTNLARTNIKMNALSNDPTIWHPIARAFGDIPMEEATKQGVIKRYQALCSQVRSLPTSEVPPDVLSCANRKVPSSESVTYLLRWQKARDTLVVWNTLQATIGSHDPISWATGDEMIKQASSEFPAWMTRNQIALSTVTTLNLAFKKLSSLPSELGNLPSLTELDISYNMLTELPITFTTLRRLSVHNNLISQIPSEIGNLLTLTTLTLSNNHFDHLPEIIGNLTLLQHFAISGNKLSKLPDTIGNLILLEHLSVCDNQLSELPKTIGNLTALRALYVTNNLLSELPIEIDHLVALQELILNHNKITSFHDTFGNFPNLIYLEMQDNQITSLPNAFGNLPNLLSLCINNNHITEFPPAFGNFPNLMQFDLSHNQIAQFPDTFFDNLGALGQLYLQHNKFTSLPAGINKLTALTTIGLLGNPLKVMPDILKKIRYLEY